MRQPLRNSAIVVLVTLSAMAGSNALYNQPGQHPAPMFGSFAAAQPEPVMPIERPMKHALLTTEATGSVDPVIAAPKLIGNADVLVVQQQLKALSLFDGAVDGIYGPQTARAIKAFEEMHGRTPKGQLTPEIVALIKAAPLNLPTSAVAPQAMSFGAAQPIAEEPLPAPAPLVATPARSVTAEITPETLDTSFATANAVPKRMVQTIAVRAETTAPAAEPMVTAALNVQQMPIELPPAIDGVDAATDTKVVAAVQRGLNSLGFLHAKIDGVAGEATAKAIRNFEVYYNYDVTGRVTRELVDLLARNGAVI
jgi:peptidoglycan hydrolase-like protein with peptidoglycan-binding domain